MGDKTWRRASKETLQIGLQTICKECYLVLRERYRFGKHAQDYNNLSRGQLPLPCKKKPDPVLVSYKESLPEEYQREFLDEFGKNNKKVQPKKKMVIAKYVVCYRYGLRFALEGEVRKLGGVQMGGKDLPF